ncbi:hypothetical protein [Sorangium cellulosum]|uniref:hypothetical protein n=1 Tax=Sorangium cellulosum TaxID=56 RepID=UPI001331B446|nr:hypothetical protein [Sorangium cellulosum]
MKEPRAKQLVEAMTPVAYHEAGHAIVAHYLGKVIALITLDWERKRGSTSMSWPDGDGRAHIHDELLIALAGEIAERRYIFANYPQNKAANLCSAYAQANTDDRQKTILYLRELDEAAEPFSPDLKARLELAREESTSVVDDQWEQIVALADELLRDSSLGGDRLVSICGAHTRAGTDSPGGELRGIGNEDHAAQQGHAPGGASRRG